MKQLRKIVDTLNHDISALIRHDSNSIYEIMKSYILSLTIKK